MNFRRGRAVFDPMPATGGVRGWPPEMGVYAKPEIAQGALPASALASEGEPINPISPKEDAMPILRGHTSHRTGVPG